MTKEEMKQMVEDLDIFSSDAKKKLKEYENKDEVIDVLIYKISDIMIEFKKQLKSVMSRIDVLEKKSKTLEQNVEKSKETAKKMEQIADKSKQMLDMNRELVNKIKEEQKHKNMH